MKFKNEVMPYRRTMIFLFSMGLLFLLLTNSAYISLYSKKPGGVSYTGLGLEAVADKFVYYALIEQGKQGHVWMTNPHTTEPQTPSLFSPHWFAIGQLSQLTGITTAAAYHSARLILSAVFLVLIWSIVKKLFPENGQRIAAFGTTLFAGGLGWVYFVANPEIADTSRSWLARLAITPADLYVTEMNTFLNFVQSPLFALAYVMLLLLWIYVVEGSVQRSFALSLGAVCLSVLVVLIHPYDTVVVALVAGSFVAWKIIETRSLQYMRPLVIIFSGLCGGALIQALILFREKSLSGWFAQNLAFSPPIGMYAWALGIMLPLWIIGIWLLVREKKLNDWWKLITIWSFSVPLALYLPIQVNRRFAAAWLVPVSLIAAYGMMRLAAKARPYAAKAASISVIGILLFSGTIYKITQYLFYTPAAAESYAYYLNSPVREMLAFATQTIPAGHALASNEEFIAMLTAAHAPVTLYVGHPDQTIQYRLKRQELTWLFSVPQTESGKNARRAFLETAGIEYLVLYTPTMEEADGWRHALGLPDPIYDTPPFVIIHVPRYGE